MSCVKWELPVSCGTLEQEEAEPACPAVSPIIAAAGNVTKMFYVSLGLDQDINI